MAQPTPYTRAVDFSDEEASGVAGRSTVRTAALDTELDAIKSTTDQIIANLSLIQRDDGNLRDAIVDTYHLTSAVLALIGSAGFNVRGSWLTATAYAVKDLVKSGTGTYVCVSAHTSGVFATDLAAGKWTVIFDSSTLTAAGISFSPTGTIAASNVQAAIAEAASEALQKASNLSDLANAATARGNLSVFSKLEIQQASGIYSAAGGTVDAITGTFTPAFASWSDMAFVIVECAGANTSTTPSFSPNGLPAKTIVDPSGLPLSPGSIPGANFRALLAYDVSLDKVLLLNPYTTTTSSAPRSQPRGRITLTTAVPVTTGDVTGATTVYYTPYVGNTVPLYDGANFSDTVFTEVSQATTDATKSPAAVGNNLNYDLFGWLDSGTFRVTRGPAWSSDTSRGTGAGTTELQLVNGVYLNKNAITNGPAALRGTYLGTIRSDGSAQINDSATKRHVWNAHNRVSRPMKRVESTASWTYASAAWRQANASTSNQLDFVVGLAEEVVQARVEVRGSNAGGNNAMPVGIALDATNTNNADTWGGDCVAGGNTAFAMAATYNQIVAIGRHFLAWTEYVSTGTSTYYGTSANVTNGGMTGTLRG